MQKRKQLQYAVVAVLGFALLFMTVGFAAYAQLVSKDSVSATTKSQVVHKAGFDAKSYLESDTSVAASEKTVALDEVSFSTRLEKPGDIYAAMVNIVNNSNVTEMLSKIEMSELSEEQAKLIDFRVSFDDEDYIGTSYDINTVFARGESGRKQMFITATYKEDAPDMGAQDLDLSVGLEFASAEE
jgi:hypothetical protein